MKYTLSAHAKDVMHHRGIEPMWVDVVVAAPTLIVKINEFETHMFGMIEANGNRCLKVVVNPAKALIVTVYFDRQMRKRGCK